MAIPVIAGSTTAVATSASLTLTKPTGVSNGDLLLILVANDNGGDGEGFIDNTTGWVQEYTEGAKDPGTYIGLYSKIADGSNEDSVTINSTDADDFVGWYLHITGQNATNPVRIIGTVNTIAGTSLTISALTTDTNTYSLAISHYSTDGADTIPLVESGTGWTNQDTLTQGADGNGVASGYSTKDISTASTSTENSVIGTAANDGIIGKMIIIAGSETGAQEYFDFSSTDGLLGSTIKTMDGILVQNENLISTGEAINTITEEVLKGNFCSTDYDCSTEMDCSGVPNATAEYYDNTLLSIGYVNQTLQHKIISDFSGIVLGENLLTLNSEMIYTGTLLSIGEGILTVNEEVNNPLSYHDMQGTLQGEGVLTGYGNIVYDGLGTFVGELTNTLYSDVLMDMSGLLLGEGVYTETDNLVFDASLYLLGENILTVNEEVDQPVSYFDMQGLLQGSVVNNLNSNIVYDNTVNLVGEGIFNSSGILISDNTGISIGGGINTINGYPVVDMQGVIVSEGIFTIVDEQVFDNTLNIIGEGLLSINEELDQPVDYFDMSGVLQGSNQNTLESNIVYNETLQLVGQSEHVLYPNLVSNSSLHKIGEMILAINEELINPASYYDGSGIINGYGINIIDEEVLKEYSCSTEYDCSIESDCIGLPQDSQEYYDVHLEMIGSCYNTLKSNIVENNILNLFGYTENTLNHVIITNISLGLIGSSEQTIESNIVTDNILNTLGYSENTLGNKIVTDNNLLTVGNSEYLLNSNIVSDNSFDLIGYGVNSLKYYSDYFCSEEINCSEELDCYGTLDEGQRYYDSPLKIIGYGIHDIAEEVQNRDYYFFNGYIAGTGINVISEEIYYKDYYDFGGEIVGLGINTLSEYVWYQDYYDLGGIIIHSSVKTLNDEILEPEDNKFIALNISAF